MLALIPARGGSKGIPNKNLRLLDGKPLIYWTIEAALQSNKIDKIVLSTEDKTIAEKCDCLNIDIPFMRPNDLAQDSSLAIDTYIYTMERLISEFGYKQDEYVVLLPTVPFRNSNDIDGAVDLFNEKKADSVISCKRVDFPSEWILALADDQRIRKENHRREMLNRQEQSEIYIPNGGVYVFKHSLIKDSRSYYFNKTYAYIMPSVRSVDIDTEDDFIYAEYLAKKGKLDA